jgi:hypothetical protein
MASKWIWAFLTGTAVGAAAAQLAMPNSTKEKRQDIAQAVNKGTERDKEKTQDFAGRAGRLADEAKAQVEQVENVMDIGTLQVRYLPVCSSITRLVLIWPISWPDLLCRGCARRFMDFGFGISPLVRTVPSSERRIARPSRLCSGECASKD